jgi:uncharacterized protein (TIGR03437 family)
MFNHPNPKRFARLTAVALLGVLPATVFGQAPGFSGFVPGNLVVTRTVYTGDATTVTAGQALPPVCPTTAACGKAVATDNGNYPSTTSANSVWNNNKVDGSFGITSPIFLDQIALSGAAVNTLAVPPGMLTTSFSSKSELAINLSADGSVLTLIGYVAPANTIDVSNSNTPGVYDPTNPAGGSYFRAVAQIGANGAIQITKTNSYSGNNGRAVMLANGLYYMSGNSNNGGGTPANVVASTGVQMAAPGQSSTTPPTQVGNFSITQVNNPSTGAPYAADKLGKDNNFRGLTIFNNTLYVTKGSGGNGIDTVYQVGNAGSLPTLANAATAPITVLPGFPTALAKNADSTFIYPFGIWFANASTLYVADEGDGVLADAAASKMAGLQKWSLVNGKWQLDYVLQNGLNLGQPYGVNGYPTTLNPATGGLRNLTGRVNNDGTVTLWAVTSTVSASGDQGADPNKLVSIIDVLANTSASGASNEQFTIVKTAAAGEVLRGVSLTPIAGAPAMASVPSIQSAASSSVLAVAPGSLAFAFGQGLASGNPGEILGPLPTTFGGTSVSIVDSAGQSWPAPLLFVSPNQVTFQVPAGVATGSAQVNLTSGGATQSATNIPIAIVAPAVFTLNGAGLAAAYAVRVSANGSQTFLNVFTLNGGSSFAANPINMGSAPDQVYLTLYGTGSQAAGTAGVKVTAAGIEAPVLYGGPSGYTGVDQVNIQLPSSLAGKGNVNIQLTANGTAANPVEITVQ